MNVPRIIIIIFILIFIMISYSDKYGCVQWTREIEIIVIDDKIRFGVDQIF